MFPTALEMCNVGYKGITQGCLGAITVKGLRVYHALLNGHSKAISMITMDVSLSLIPLMKLAFRV